MFNEIKNIYLYIDNNQYGPFSEDEVVENIKSGGINKTTLIWDHLLSQWIKIIDIPKFADIFELQENKSNPNYELKPNLGTLIDFSIEQIDGYKKRFVRIKKMLNISYCIIDPKTKQALSDLRETVTINISGSGLAFRETEAPITPGVYVDLRIQFPKIKHIFRIFGNVVRTNEIEEGKAYEIGIKFLDLADEFQKHLLYYLNTLLTDAPDSK